MSSPIVRNNFCKCGRNLYGTSIRLGFKDCGRCRRATNQAARYVAEKAVQVPLGRHVGEFIHHRLASL